MDIFRGKQFTHLCKHVLHEFERRILARAINFREYAPSRPYHIPLTGTPQPGIGRQCRRGMSRHFDFRDDRNEPFGRIGYDVTNLSLRIVSSRRYAVVDIRIASKDCFGTP